MDAVSGPVIGAVIGALVGALIAGSAVAVILNRKHAAKQQALEASLAEAEKSKSDAEKAATEARVRLEETEKSHALRLQELKEAREELTHVFRSVGAQALESNNAQFLQLAQQRFATLEESAKKELEQREEKIQLLVEPMQKHLDALEDARKTAYERLNQQLEILNKETGNLSRSMRDFRQRGKWGELSLERAFEAAGLRLGVDYFKQVILPGDDGRQIPDYVVQIPGGKKMIVDVKTPYDRYDEALGATDVDEQNRLFKEHARVVRGHIKTLRDKDYPRRIPEAMPFVVMFLPLESMLAEAMKQDVSLVDHGMEQRVAIATPTTIVAMLSAIAYAWQQEEFAKNCLQIQQEARKLYEGLATAIEKVNAVSRRLNSTITAQNELVSYFDNTVHRTAAKVRDLRGGTNKALAEVETVPTPAALSSRSEGTLPLPGVDD